MAAFSDDTIAALVARADGGDVEARGALFSALYDDLHRLAQAHVRRSVGPLTLGATTLLHEAYLAISRSAGAVFPDRNRFLGYASRAMRGLVINYVRERSVQKRGGDLTFVPLDESRDAGAARADELEALGVALDDLARCNPIWPSWSTSSSSAASRSPRLRRCAGVSERTVQRDWAKARLLLHRALEDG